MMLTTTQAAKIAKVLRVTILKWIERGHLKATAFGNVWMIDEADLRAMLAVPRKAGRKPKEKNG